MRLIDADALNLAFPITDDLYGMLKQVGIEMVKSRIADAPTVDAVEVVRCEKCFYAIPYNERWTRPKNNNFMWCKRNEDARPLDWFCADGERREDGEIH